MHSYIYKHIYIYIYIHDTPNAFVPHILKCGSNVQMVKRHRR